MSISSATSQSFYLSPCVQNERLVARASRPCVPVAPRLYAYSLALLFCVFASTVFAQKQTGPSQPVILPPEQAAKEGRALVDEILAQKPAANSTNNGVMTIRDDAKKTRTAIPIAFSVSMTASNWVSKYTTQVPGKEHYADLIVLHSDGQPNRYLVPNVNRPPSDTSEFRQLEPNQIFTPFAGSDFYLADLGLEFFHWPDQHLVKKEMKRSRSCKVLESINPQPGPGVYSRVVSWIDNDSDGIVMAQAFDSQGKLLKEFIPKKVKKVEGQWQLEEMEIDNAQANSITRVDFDLSAPK
jgi:hypothetical protein